MKPIILLALISLSNILYAQNTDNEQEMQTLFGNKSFTFGGFGGPSVSYSSFNGSDAWLVGGMGAAIVNHSFFFGGGGYGIVNSPFFADVNNNEGAYTEGGYGGGILGFVAMPHKVVHLAFPVLIGGGSLIYTDKRMSHNTHGSHFQIIDQTEFFVIEPGIEVELNVFRFMRVAAGVKYRYTSKLKLIDTPNNAFNSLGGNITFKFGRF